MSTSIPRHFFLESSFVTLNINSFTTVYGLVAKILALEHTDYAEEGLNYWMTVQESLTKSFTIRISY